jgi:hypothetical protein
MKQFILDKNCRWIALDKEIDRPASWLGCKIEEERCDICKGKLRGTRRRRVVVGNWEVILNKRLDAASVDGVSATASKAESKGDYLLTETDNDGEVLDTEVTEWEAHGHEGLEEDRGETDMQEEFMAERRRYKVIRQRRIKRRTTKRMRIEDLPS